MAGSPAAVVVEPAPAATRPPADMIRAPFRLAIYTEAVARGGAEMNLANVIAALPAAIDLHLIGPDREVLDWLAGERPGVAIHVIPTVDHRSDLAGMRAHRRLFRSIGADIVQFHLAMMPTAQWALLAAQTIPGQRTLVVENSTMGAWSSTSKLLKKLTSRRATGHVSVGRQSSRIIEQVGGLRPGSVGTIYHGVPEVRHDPAPDAEEFRIVNIARHDPVKGVDVLLDAMALLPDDVVLAQFGGGPQTPELEAQRDRLGLGERVTMASIPWSERAADRICDHDLFVLSSRTEGLPVSIMEAMLAGVAVIAADVGSVTEVVSDGVTGLVVPPEDPAAIAAAIAELRADPERRRSMAATARRVATERFTVEATVRDYCALFERILAP